MRTGIELLELSKESPEPLLDSCYVSDSLIISDSPDAPNELMTASLTLRNFITAFQGYQEQQNEAECLRVIQEIKPLLLQRNINTTEFVGYWSSQDMTHSIYEKLSEEDKDRVLWMLLERYLACRHSLYRAHRYSHATLQARRDAFSHKGFGNLGANKMQQILQDNEFHEIELAAIDEVAHDDRGYYFVTKQGKNELIELLDNRGYRFDWLRNYAGRIPDYVLVYGDKICVFEHKHVKEDGSGQNSQIKQLIDLISGVEDDANIHYVAFLDGIYFNTIFCREQESLTPRQQEQKRMVIEALEAIPSNYFLNTEGVRAFLEDLVNDEG